MVVCQFVALSHHVCRIKGAVNAHNSLVQRRKETFAQSVCVPIFASRPWLALWYYPPLRESQLGTVNALFTGAACVTCISPNWSKLVGGWRWWRGHSASATANGTVRRCRRVRCLTAIRRHSIICARHYQAKVGTAWAGVAVAAAAAVAAIAVQGSAIKSVPGAPVSSDHYFVAL